MAKTKRGVAAKQTQRPAARKKKTDTGPRDGKRRGGSVRERRLYDAAWIAARLDEFARDVVERGPAEEALVVGVQRRGAELARRVRALVERLTGVKVPLGELDVTLYRDDLLLGAPTGPRRRKGATRGTKLGAPLDCRLVYLVDDVLYTGRTIRAALDQLMDFGRPARVRYYTLLDRGGRELPIQADVGGGHVAVPAADRLEVRLREVDGEEGVFVVPGGMFQGSGASAVADRATGTTAAIRDGRGKPRLKTGAGDGGR